MIRKIAITPIGVSLFALMVIVRLFKGPLEPQGATISDEHNWRTSTRPKYRFYWWCSSRTNWVVNNDINRSFCGHEYQKRKEGKKNMSLFIDWIFSENHTMFAYIKHITS